MLDAGTLQEQLLFCVLIQVFCHSAGNHHICAHTSRSPGRTFCPFAA